MTATLTPVKKRSALTKGQLPKWAPYLVLAVALVLGAAILALIGFNAFGWGIVSAILFAAGLVGWSAAVEGSRKAKDKLATCLVVGSFLIALLPAVLRDLDGAGQRPSRPHGPGLPDHLDERRHRRLRQQERRGRRARSSAASSTR